jgi:hypothetical protein
VRHARTGVKHCDPTLIQAGSKFKSLIITMLLRYRPLKV